MEMQPRKRAGVAADRALAAGFRYQHPLDLASAPLNGARAAEAAAESVRAAPHKGRQPMDRAVCLGGLGARCPGWSRFREAPPTRGHQSVATQPMTDRRVGDVKTLSHRPN